MKVEAMPSKQQAVEASVEEEVNPTRGEDTQKSERPSCVTCAEHMHGRATVATQTDQVANPPNKSMLSRLLEICKWGSLGIIFGLLVGLGSAVWLLNRFPTLRRVLFGEEVDMQQVTIPEQSVLWRWLFVPVVSTLWCVCTTMLRLTPPWLMKKIAEHTSVQMVIHRLFTWVACQNILNPAKRVLWT